MFEDDRLKVLNLVSTPTRPARELKSMPVHIEGLDLGTLLQPPGGQVYMLSSHLPTNQASSMQPSSTNNSKNKRRSELEMLTAQPRQTEQVHIATDNLPIRYKCTHTVMYHWRYLREYYFLYNCEESGCVSRDNYYIW